MIQFDQINTALAFQNCASSLLIYHKFSLFILHRDCPVLKRKGKIFTCKSLSHISKVLAHFVLTWATFLFCFLYRCNCIKLYVTE